MRVLSKQVVYSSSSVYGSSRSCCLSRLLIRSCEVLASIGTVLSSISYVSSSSCSTTPDLDIEHVVQSFLQVKFYSTYGVRP